MSAETGAGSQSSGRRSTVSAFADWQSAMTSAIDGLAAGSLARHRLTSSISRSGTPLRSGSSWTIRYRTPCEVPSPNAGDPVAAYAATWPSAKTSVAGVTLRPAACSGAMNEGVPMVTPLPVSEVASAAWAMPKSMTRGPSAASSTLDGLRSRWTMPAPWMTCSASAMPAISSTTVSTGSAPCATTASASEGPGTYAVASHGWAASVAASITGAVNRPCTRCADLTSWANRRRNSASSPNSGRITLMATGRPPGVYDRYTLPMPPAPSLAASRYPAMVVGSSPPSGWKTWEALPGSGC
ncbi:hypothetical protein EES42_23355 [Streptomyces sp. ADI95-17]|nr:hypothetical protein EES42_23355 [Streptomyces sp. ADI95-17]